MRRRAAIGRGVIALVGSLSAAGLAAPARVHAGQARLAPGPAHQLQRALHRDLLSYLKTYRKTEHISAASVAVGLRGGAVLISAAAGTVRYGGGRAVTPEDLFQIGSITKSFTAVILLQLEAEGRLRLSDPLGKWLPQYRQWKGVTIRQLLNMTSGIPDFLHAPAFQSAYARSPRARFTPAELVGYVKGMSPTTGWHYSNTNYALAQMIIRKVTGHGYAFELAKRILRPLGLHQTFYNGGIAPARIRSRMPAGYFSLTSARFAGLRALHDGNVNADSLSMAGAAGGIIATPENVARWVYALFQGPVLAPRQRKQLRSLVSVKTGEPISVADASHPGGYGLGVSQSYQGRNTGAAWTYEGQTLGYRMLYAWLPTSDAVVVVALNSSTDNADDHIDRLMRSILGDLNPRVTHQWRHAVVSARGVGRESFASTRPPRSG